jgi:hypothetical protein
MIGYGVEEWDMVLTSAHQIVALLHIFKHTASPEVDVQSHLDSRQW